MWIVQVALKRPYTFIVLAFLIAIFGSLSAVRTPTDIFPSINIPVVSVVWTYSGLLPQDMSDREWRIGLYVCFQRALSASDAGLPRQTGGR